MKRLASIVLLASFALSSPVLAQERPAKDGDEIDSSADREELVGLAVRRCVARSLELEQASFRDASPARLQPNLSAPERFWAAPRSQRAAAAAKERCAS